LFESLSLPLDSLKAANTDSLVELVLLRDDPGWFGRKVHTVVGRCLVDVRDLSPKAAEEDAQPLELRALNESPVGYAHIRVFLPEQKKAEITEVAGAKAGKVLIKELAEAKDDKVGQVPLTGDGTQSAAGDETQSFDGNEAETSFCVDPSPERRMTHISR